MAFITMELQIAGMTCVNCQNRIEQKLLHTSGVKCASVSYEGGTANITYESEKISFEEIVSVIEDLDYDVVDGKDDSSELIRTVSLLVIIIALYVIIQYLGILNLLVPGRLADSTMGYGMLFVVGLLTSVHCIAMCGGINLTQCLPGGGRTDGESVFAPSLLYNMGRVISYTAVGSILGLVGMFLGGDSEAGVSVLLQGILKIIAGLFMVIMGVNMLNLFPWLRRWNLRMPRVIALKIGKAKRNHTQPFIVGLFNGLMPCGPLQAMQILALASGNPLQGALSMLFFSLGTVPLMLGLGSLVSALGKKFAHAVMHAGAVLVVVLGLAMLTQGGLLSGIFTWHYGDTESAAEEMTAEIVDGVQIVNSELLSGQYPSITVQEGIPVRWNINAPEGSINGCNYKMLIQEYGIEYTFEEGDNIIEFTPTGTGEISYTCWMGMIRGKINVTEGE